MRSPGYRGCAFVNAAAEFPDPDHPVHRAVVRHRRWFLETVTSLFAAITTAEAEHAGRHFVMIRDGAMSAGYLEDPVSAGETLLRGIEGLLRIHATRGQDDARGQNDTGGQDDAGGQDEHIPPASRTPPQATGLPGIECGPPSA
jgi:hypothetical protein